MNGLPAKITPDPLVETIVEVGVAAACSQDLWAGMVKNRVEALGYKYLYARRNGQLLPPGFFVRENIRFSFCKSTVAFNCSLGNYVGWPAYSVAIEEVIAALRESGIAKGFTHVHVRYINEFRDVDLWDKIYLAVSGGEDGYRAQDIALQREREGMVSHIAVQGLRRRQTAGGASVRSSLIDVGVQCQVACTDDAPCMEALERCHQMEKEAFFRLLKDDFLQSLNPVYEHAAR